MRAIATVLMLAALTLLVTPAASGKGKPPKDECPLELAQLNLCDPNDVVALGNTEPAVTGLTNYRAVSPQEAMAAADRPGAVTEVASGLTLEQATGADAGTVTALEVEDDGGGPGDTAYKLCRFGTLAAYYGTWPVNHDVYDNTYWCWNSSSLNLTYRSTTVTTGTYLCGTDDTYSFKYAGGIGYPYVYIEAGAYFHCNTSLPWWTIHYHNCLHDVWYPYGARTDAYGCFG